MQDTEYALQCFPLARIPTCLQEGHLKRWKPPIIHLAFLVTFQWAAAYARKHNLVEQVKEVRKARDFTEEELKEIRELEAEIKEERKRNASYERIDVGCAPKKIVDHINANAGVESFKVTYAFSYTYPCIMDEGYLYYGLLSFRTNYDTNPPPDFDDIMKLYRYLEAEYPPAWHLDGFESGWKRR